MSIRGKKKWRDARRDTPYLSDLPEADREYLEAFLDAEYGNDYTAQVALAGSEEKAKQWQRDVNAASYADRTDVMFAMKRVGFQSVLAKDEGEYRSMGPEGPVEEPLQNAPRYTAADYMPAPPADAEEALAAALDATAEEAQYLPYGDSPKGLMPGHRVLICLPAHYLKDRTGTVRAYRPWTEDYLIEADRPARRGRDGPGAKTTWAWIPHAGLKRVKPRLAK